MITTKTLLITALLLSATALPLHMTDAQRPVELPPTPVIVYQISTPKVIAPAASVMPVSRETIVKDEPIEKEEAKQEVKVEMKQAVKQEVKQEMKKETPEPEIVIVNKIVTINKSKTYVQCRDEAFTNLYERVNMELARSTRCGPTDVPIEVEL